MQNHVRRALAALERLIGLGDQREGVAQDSSAVNRRADSVRSAALKGGAACALRRPPRGPQPFRKRFTHTSLRFAADVPPSRASRRGGSRSASNDCAAAIPFLRLSFQTNGIDETPDRFDTDSRHAAHHRVRSRCAARGQQRARDAPSHRRWRREVICRRRRARVSIACGTMLCSRAGCFRIRTNSRSSRPRSGFCIDQRCAGLLRGFRELPSGHRASRP